jgi:hypothetical protein
MHRFREFWAKANLENLMVGAGIHAAIAALKEITDFCMKKEVPLDDNLLALDTLFLKHGEVGGGLLSDELKKVYVTDSISCSEYSIEFKALITLIANLDEAKPAAEKLTYQSFILNVKNKFSKCVLDLNMSGRGVTHSNKKQKEKLNVIKHSNKTGKKPRSDLQKKRPMKEVTCYACNKKGHYSTSQDCELFGSEAGKANVEVNRLKIASTKKPSIAKEFAKKIAKRNG